MFSCSVIARTFEMQKAGQSPAFFRLQSQAEARPAIACYFFEDFFFAAVDFFFGAAFLWLLA
jgi:hypothetical protein